MAKQAEARPIPGIRLGCAASGCRDSADLALIEIAAGSRIAAMFTRNACSAAPVQVARAHLRQQQQDGIRYCLINAGNANAGTGSEGHDDCVSLCQALARLADCPVQAILPFSTGIIGRRLPLRQLAAGVPEAISSLAADNWLAAAAAITTTDRFIKAGAQHWTDSGGNARTVTGIAKGAGMICPDMATMLAFVACDAPLEQSALERIMAAAVADSFHRISVDGDTSTNDAIVIIATGEATGMSAADTGECELYITRLCRQLAYDIVRDGEGASKLIEIHVLGGADNCECLRVARTVASSPLVKTAFFGCDPNWGRIMAAIGRAGIDGLNVDKLGIRINSMPVARHGRVDPDFDESAVATALRHHTDIKVEIELGRGSACDYIVTCDLGHNYIDLNSAYGS